MTCQARICIGGIDATCHMLHLHGHGLCQEGPDKSPCTVPQAMHSAGSQEPDAYHGNRQVLRGKEHLPELQTTAQLSSG